MSIPREAKEVRVDSRNRDFPVTSWTLLAEALASNSRAVMARDEFARRYRRPILNGSLCVTGCYAKRAVRRGFSRPLPRILTLCTNWKKPK